MTPVISPWVFYLMYLVDNVSSISAIVFIIAIIAVGLLAILFMVSIGDEEVNDASKKMLKASFVALVISGLITTVVPNESTITKMIVAQNVTYERVEVATDVVETVYNDIMNLFDKSSDSNG